ncbi:MAG TPA: adenylate/guanylate cyclase domain-containing protein [Xanthobacteraceae bacterium]|nr:adenylate/guanylate cyclase domain-containing protein [Xanthobacteraceae bacterium]
MAGVTALSAVFGVAVASLTGGEAITGILSGVMIALAISALEILLQGRWTEAVRRWPVAVVFLLRTALYGAAFFFMIHLANALASRSWAPLVHPTRLVSNTTVLVSFGFAFAVNLAIMLGRLLGPRILVSLLTGRYHRPREEQRIVLFMDLRGSTQAAEKLGDEQFHRFLNQVFWDVTDPVLEAGGEIYRYVGDEIIVTWPVRRGAIHAACIACVFAVEDALARRRDQYLAEFGIEPRLRSALHAGPLIVGEMGDVKREIVMLGDTMNTAARIEGICRTMQKDYIASAPALEFASLPAGVRAQSLGPVALRGKESGIELFALTRE